MRRSEIHPRRDRRRTTRHSAGHTRLCSPPPSIVGATSNRVSAFGGSPGLAAVLMVLVGAAILGYGLLLVPVSALGGTRIAAIGLSFALAGPFATERVGERWASRRRTDARCRSPLPPPPQSCWWRSSPSTTRRSVVRWNGAGSRSATSTRRGPPETARNSAVPLLRRFVATAASESLRAVDRAPGR